MQKTLFLYTTVFLIFIIGTLPIINLLQGSMFIDNRLNIHGYLAIFQNRHLLKLMSNSFILSFFVTLFATLFGTALGVILGKTDLAFKNIFLLIFVIPLLIPPYIFAVSWFDLLNNSGFIANLFNVKISEIINNFLFSIYGSTLVLSIVFLPIPLLLTRFFLRTIDPKLEEAGKLICSEISVFKGITFPLLYKSISLSAVLVFLLTFANVSVTNYLRYKVYAIESFTQFSAFYDIKTATIMSTPLLLIALIILLLQKHVLKYQEYKFSISSNEENLFLISPGRYSVPIFLTVAVFSLMFVVAPLFALLFEASRYHDYVDLFYNSFNALMHSLIYAFLGASLLTIFGFFLGYAIYTKTVYFWQEIDFFTVFQFALPSTVLGVALIYLYNNSLLEFIYTTPIIIIFAYLAKYIVISSRIFATHLARIPSTIEESAQLGGASRLNRVFYIILPLTKKGFVVSWIASYIFCLRDTDLTMLVYPPGYETLNVRILTLMANGSSSLIASLSVIMIATTLIPIVAIYYISLFKKGVNR